MPSESVTDKVRTFFEKYIRTEQFDNDQDVFAAGLVSSLMAMQLVLFVEKEFSISVNDDELDMDNFRSINRVATFVEKKTAA